MASLVAIHSSIQVIAVTFVSRAVSAMQAVTRVDAHAEAASSRVATRVHYRCSRCQHAPVRSVGRVNDAVQHRAVVCGAFVEPTDVVLPAMKAVTRVDAHAAAALPHVCTIDAAGASTRECRSIGRVNDAVQHRAVVCGAFVERMDAGVHVFCRLHQPCKPSQVSMHGMSVLQRFLAALA